MTEMNIVNPEDSTYLARASERKMSYYREKSLKRAVSYRAVLVKKDGTLANSQYNDQYLDREAVQADLKRQQSRRSVVGTAPDDATRASQAGMSQMLGKYVPPLRARAAGMHPFLEGPSSTRSRVC